MEEGCKNALKQALALVNNNGQSKMYMLNKIVQEVFHKWWTIPSFDQRLTRKKNWLCDDSHQ